MKKAKLVKRDELPPPAPKPAKEKPVEKQQPPAPVSNPHKAFHDLFKT